MVNRLDNFFNDNVVLNAMENDDTKKSSIPQSFGNGGWHGIQGFAFACVTCGLIFCRSAADRTFLPYAIDPPTGTPLALGGAHTGLLYSHPLAQQHLAPSLLLLYGDVEHTG